MKFKDWFELQEINKGLQRTFIAQNPHLPRYVAKQVLQNRVAPLWKNVWAGQAPTTNIDIRKVLRNNQAPPASAEVMDKNDVFTKTKAQKASQAPTAAPTATRPPNFNGKHPVYPSPSAMYQDPAVRNITGNQNWKEEILDISPLDFSEETIQHFLRHEFGSSPSLSRHVKNHDDRMNVQSQLAQQRGQGENEPIMLTKKNGKYVMQEGWHRLYSYLKQYSAPPEEWQKVKSGRIHEVDLARWKPIRIKAYVGS
jgi:hypothetical protein